MKSLLRMGAINGGQVNFSQKNCNYEQRIKKNFSN